MNLPKLLPTNDFYVRFLKTLTLDDSKYLEYDKFKEIRFQFLSTAYEVFCETAKLEKIKPWSYEEFCFKTYLGVYWNYWN